MVQLESQSTFCSSARRSSNSFWSVSGLFLRSLAAMSADLRAVFRVGHQLHPGDVLAVERFLDGDVHHPDVRGCAVPVLLVRRDPHRIPGANLLYWPAFSLNPPEPRDDVQRLPERMGVPGGARAGLEADAAGTHARRFRRLDDGVL